MSIHDRFDSGPTIHPEDVRHLDAASYAAALKKVLDPRTRLNPTNPPPITFAPVVEKPPAVIDARTLSRTDYAAQKAKITRGHR